MSGGVCLGGFVLIPYQNTYSFVKLSIFHRSTEFMNSFLGVALISITYFITSCFLLGVL